jgi:HAD superfamily hydrolase (TIGR01509 family)
MSEQKRGVLFDVDGTLVDTAYIHAVCWWEALRQSDHVVPMAVIGAAIGMGSDKLLSQVIGEQPDNAEEITAAHDALYRTYWDRLNPLPGARDLVARCARAGLAVVLASSASQPELDQLRRVLDVDEHVTAATSSADADESKPDPGIVQSALDAAGLDADHAVFVGDAVWDVEAASKAGVPCVGVATGAMSEHELAEAGAVTTYPDPQTLLRRFGESPLARISEGKA